MKKYKIKVGGVMPAHCFDKERELERKMQKRELLINIQS